MTYHPASINLMAASELRDAIEAVHRGDAAAATAALMSIDADSWHGIEHRLGALGASFPDLLAASLKHGPQSSL